MSPRRSPPPTSSRRRWTLIAGIGVAVLVTVVLAVVWSRGPAPASSCGWDLTTVEGRAANQAYLTSTADWLADQPAGATPPPPTSPFWHGECPVDPDQPTGPPVDEAHDDE